MLPFQLLVTAGQGRWHFPCPSLRLRVQSRETGLVVLSRVNPLIVHSQVESGAYPRGSPAFFPDGLIYLYRRPLSGHSRVYQATQLRTDGVHCRETAATGPASSPQDTSIINVCCLYRFHSERFFMRLSFSARNINYWSTHS